MVADHIHILSGRPSSNRRPRSAGFTLIELMIVVAVIAILAAIAFPSYRAHIIKTRRGAAAACMMEQAQYMERYYSTKMTYVGATVQNTSCKTDIERFYTLAFTATPTATEYGVKATPTAVQDDSKCGTLTIDQKGVRTASGTAGSGTQCF